MFGDRTPLKVRKHFEHYQSCKEEKELQNKSKKCKNSKEDEKNKPEIKPFFSWECLSLIRGVFKTSFDIVIQDMHHLFCLIHVTHRYAYDDFQKPVKMRQDIRR